MLYVLLSYATQTTELRRTGTSGGGFTPPAFARGKSMESLLRVASAPRRFPAFGSRTSPISNRYNKLLEFPVTYTKHTLALRSNRYKNTFVPTSRFSAPLRSSFVIPPVNFLTNAPNPVTNTCFKTCLHMTHRRPKGSLNSSGGRMLLEARAESFTGVSGRSREES
jgi:hypothetical protein